MVAIGSALDLAGHAQEPELPCSEETPAPGDAGYKWRGDRCEGTYVVRVAGGNVVPHSFTSGVIALSLAEQQLTLRWKAPKQEPTVSLQVWSVDKRYRMLKRMPAAEGVYTWPKPAHLAKQPPIGVLAQVSDRRYVPTYSAAESHEYIATFYSTDRLTAVDLGVRNAADEQVHSKERFDATSRVVQIAFLKSKLKAPGEYYVKLSAQNRMRTGVSSEIRFFHP